MINLLYIFFQVLAICLYSLRFFSFMQGRNYKNIEYFKSLKIAVKKFLKAFTLDFSILLAFDVVSILMEEKSPIVSLMMIGMVVFEGFSSFVFSRKDRVKLQFTKRLVRLLLCFAVVVFVSLLVVTFKFESLSIEIVSFGVMFAFCPILVSLANVLMCPIELIIASCYIKKAKDILKKHPNTICIGITGSYGKTTVKHILSGILSSKYTVCRTPFSYNTPMGICKTIIENFNGEEILVVEMGARRLGDIRKLVSIVPLDYAIITGVANQHIETFKSFENVVREKISIVKGLKNKENLFATGDDEVLVKRLASKIPLSHLPKSSDFVKNVKIENFATDFTLEIEGKRAETSTKLVGNHNISNISLAVAVAKHLSVDFYDIVKSIEKLQPIPSRLEVKKANGIVIVDDSYNANPKGTVALCEFLKQIKGRRTVITSGLVELGECQERENFLLGKRLSEVCEKVILVGEKTVAPIENGLVSENFTNFVKRDSLDLAMVEFKKDVQKGDILVFLNDLPQFYLN